MTLLSKPASRRLAAGEVYHPDASAPAPTVLDGMLSVTVLDEFGNGSTVTVIDRGESVPVALLTCTELTAIVPSVVAQREQPADARAAGLDAAMLRLARFAHAQRQDAAHALLLILRELAGTSLALSVAGGHEVRITQEQLGQFTGNVRTTMLHALKDLERDGLVQRDHGRRTRASRILVLDEA